MRARATFRWCHAGDLALPTPRRRHVHERAEPLRQRQPAPDRGEVERDAHARRVGQDAEEEAAHEAVPDRAQHLLLDDGAGALDQAVVADAGRARRDARHAAEAAVEVLRHGRVELDRAVEQRVHQVDASARRVHLLVPEDVGRARRQAEPAVDAVGGVLADHGRSEERRATLQQLVASACMGLGEDLMGVEFSFDAVCDPRRGFVRRLQQLVTCGRGYACRPRLRPDERPLRRCWPAPPRARPAAKRTRPRASA